MAISDELWRAIEVYVSESPLEGSRFLAAGPLHTPLPTGKKNVPRLVTAPAPEWIDPTIDPEIPETQPVYDIGALEVKSLKCLVPVSNDALRYTPDLDPVLLSDIEKAMGTKLDEAYLVGAADGPSGILKVENKLVTTAAWATDAELLVQTVIDAGLDVTRGVFFASPATVIASLDGEDKIPKVQSPDSIISCMGFPVIPVPALTASPVLAFVIMDAVVIGDGGRYVALDEGGRGFQSDYSDLRVVFGTDIKRRSKWAAAWVDAAY